MDKIILCRGIPGSGKTTWTKNYCKEHPNTIRVNRDDIRAMFNIKWSKEIERIVIESELNIIGTALYNGMNIVIDDVSNLNSITIERIISLVQKINSLRKHNNYDIEYQDFFIPLNTCIERDSKRENPIGAEIITNTYNKYKDIIETNMFNSINNN